MTIYLTIRRFNSMTNYGEKVKTGKDLNFFCGCKFHKIIDETNILFRLSRKNRAIKKHWIAKNVQDIYKYHRVGRLSRINHE